MRVRALLSFVLGLVVATALLGSMVVFGQADELVGRLRPLIVNIEQEVPVMAEVPLQTEAGLITATVPMTLNLSLKVSLSGALTPVLTVADTAPAITVTEAGQDNTALAPAVQPENSSLNRDALMAQIAEIEATAPTFSDTFPSDNNAWFTGDNEFGSIGYADGALHLRVKATSQDRASITRSRAVDQLNLADLMVKVDVKNVAGPADARYGIIFRLVDPQNFYSFFINNAGQYRLGKARANRLELLKDWTTANPIKTGKNAVNELAVLAQGSNFVLLVNNEIVAQVQDESLAQGSVALVAGGTPSGDVDISFDNLWLWRLTSDATSPNHAGAAAVPTPNANAGMSQLTCSQLKFLAQKNESIAASSAKLCSSGDTPAATAACATGMQAYSLLAAYEGEMAKRCGG